MGKKNILPTFSIAVVGSSDVGKYSLSQQYAKGWIQPQDTNTSITAKCPSKVVRHQSGKYVVKTIVCKDFEPDILLECDGIVMVYSVIDKTSFTYAKTTGFKQLNEAFKAEEKDNSASSNRKWSEEEQLQELSRIPAKSPNHSEVNLPVVLIGNKVDAATLDRQVDADAGQSLSYELSCVGFYETSALCNTQVPQAFECLTSEIISRRTNSVALSTQKKTTNSCCIIS